MATARAKFKPLLRTSWAGFGEVQTRRTAAQVVPEAGADEHQQDKGEIRFGKAGQMPVRVHSVWIHEPN
jgi:hypothetical protein